MTIELHNSLVIGAVLFVLGTVGFLTRRNLIVMFLSAELMLQAVAINLIAFGRAHENYHGQSFTIFLLTVAACEAAIALVLFLALYQRLNTLDVGVWHELGESTPDESTEINRTEKHEVADESLGYPTLPPAGQEPSFPKLTSIGRKEAAHNG
jgi:NADH-quinone oxidoreductase subunit K